MNRTQIRYMAVYSGETITKEVFEQIADVGTNAQTFNPKMHLHGRRQVQETAKFLWK